MAHCLHTLSGCNCNSYTIWVDTLGVACQQWSAAHRYTLAGLVLDTSQLQVRCYLGASACSSPALQEELTYVLQDTSLVLAWDP